MAITSAKTGSSFTSLIKYDTFLGPNSAYIPSSFESIATVTASGSASTINITSIPGTYKHLQLRAIFKTGGATNLGVEFNSVTTATYAYHSLTGNGATATAAGSASQSEIVPGGSNVTANVYTTFIMDIIDYASTSKYKTVRTFLGVDDNTGTTTSYVKLSSGLWQSNSAITSINLFDFGFNNFTNKSSFALYGIKGA